MRNQKSVSRYITRGQPGSVSQPVKPKAQSTPPLNVKPQSLKPKGPPLPKKETTEDPMMVQSLTPTNVLQKIHQDIIQVLGIQEGIAGRFTDLEQRLITSVEKIVRKGHCPSILVREKELMESLLALKRYFDQDSIEIASGGKTQNVPVFGTLYKYAKEAAFCDQRLRETRLQRSRESDTGKRAEMDKYMNRLKDQKDESLMHYQRIIFSFAEQLNHQNKNRRITLFGRQTTLDELLAFLKKGGNLEKARSESSAPAQPVQETASPVFNNPGHTALDIEDTFHMLEEDENDNPLDQSLSNSFDDVVDWREIRTSENHFERKKNPPESDQFTFNL